MAVDKRWLWGGAAVAGALILLYVARSGSAAEVEAEAASANDGSLATLASYIAAMPSGGGSVSGGTVTQPSTSTAVDLVALQKLSNDAAEARSESGIKVARVDMLGNIAKSLLSSATNTAAGRMGGQTNVQLNVGATDSSGGPTYRVDGAANVYTGQISYAPPPPPPPPPAPVVVKKKGK